MFASAVIAPMAMASGSADTVLIRDRVGGERSSGQPNGIFAEGTGSRVRGTNDCSHFQSTATGLLDLEINSGGGYEAFKAYSLDGSRDLYIPINRGDAEGEEYQASSLILYRNEDRRGLNASDRSALELLFGNAFLDSQTSRTKAAAFQWLVWEIVQDSEFNLSGDCVRLANNEFNKDIRAQITDWAAAIKNSWTSKAEVTVYTHPCFGPIVTSPIPTPSGMAVAGLFGVFAVRRNRRDNRPEDRLGELDPVAVN